MMCGNRLRLQKNLTTREINTQLNKQGLQEHFYHLDRLEGIF